MFVTLLTDYGRDDDFVGVVHGVIHSICPAARVLDITHGIPPYGVRAGSIVLRNALPYMPHGVHMAVVDPGVGTQRRALALRTGDGRLLVGPDNGLLSLAWERCGGVRGAVEVSGSAHRLEPVSATFHGRDLFAPVSAHLAAGEALEDAGDPLDPDTLARLELPSPRRDGDALVLHALVVDRFGNVGLDAEGERLAELGLALGAELELEADGELHRAVLGRAFADVEPGELVVLEDSYGMLAVARGMGDAAAALGLAPDSELRLRAR